MTSNAIRYTAMGKGGDAGDAKEAAASPLRDIRQRAASTRKTTTTPPPPALRKRTSSAPGRIGGTRRRRRRLLVEDHYRVDPDDKALLPGLPAVDDDWERDLHDFFNLVSLVPVVVLNAINWDWDALLDPRSRKTLRECWTGEWFPAFYAVTIGYFVADLLWVASVPRCVKSPGVIVQHHVATILYLIIPYLSPEDGWLMGACLSVEANTWLLIARRVFNKQGFGPWVWSLGFFSIRVKLISILFYATWISIRCYIYPIILGLLWTLWHDQWNRTGAVFHSRYAVALVLHSIFCALNFKWTFDLFMSKCRALKSGKASGVQKGL